MVDRTKCTVCHGQGYIRCDCWPGDCICGFGDETCDECEGEGFIHDHYADDDGYCDHGYRSPETCPYCEAED